MSDRSIQAESGRSYTWDHSLLLGCGSSGVQVFEATDDLGRSLALKQVPLDQRSDSRWLIDHYRAEEEPRIGALLRQRAKHVLPVFDWAKDDGALYLLMEKAEGTLQGQLDVRSVPHSEALKILRQCLLGLVELAAPGVLHRDLAPSNILRHQGRWKLGDFGVSRMLKADPRDHTWGPVGHLEYTAPEVLEDHEPPSVASDLYSLGCVYFHLLTGAPPFTGRDLARDQMRTLPSYPGDLDPRTLRVLKALLAKNRLERPQSAAEALRLIGPEETPFPVEGELVKLELEARELDESRAALRAEYATIDELRLDGRAELNRIWRDLVLGFERSTTNVEYTDEVETKRQLTLSRHITLTIQTLDGLGSGGDLLLMSTLRVQKPGMESYPANLLYLRDTVGGRWVIARFVPARGMKVDNPVRGNPLAYGDWGSLVFDDLDRLWREPPGPGWQPAKQHQAPLTADALRVLFLHHAAGTDHPG